MRRSAALLVLVAFGCGARTPDSTPPPVTDALHSVLLSFDSTLCDGEDALKGATSFLVKVNGITVIDGETAGQFRSGPVTAGTLQVAARDSTFSVIAHGTALLNVGAADVTVRVAMRPAGRFFPLGEAGKCALLERPRAGHQATLLADGRVLVTGGYEATGTDSSGHTYTRSAEMVNVAAGTVSPAAPMQAFNEEARAHHSAVRLADGRVLVMGGEHAEGASMAVTDSALAYDPDKNQWATVDALRMPRSRAQVGSDLAGRILLVGGYSTKAGVLTPEASYEYFDPTTKVFQRGRGVLGARALGAIAQLSGTAFVITGGSDGTKLLGDSMALLFNAAQGFMPDTAVGALASLTEPRTRAAYAKLAPDQLVVAGGDLGMSPDRVTSPSNALDVIPYGVTHQHLSAKLPEAVADACAVSIPGGALVIGGEKSDGTGSSKVVRLSDESSAQLVPDPDIQHPGALREGRSRHTCTTLADGSILVIGGVSGRGPNKTLRSLELFISGAPAP